ncbi:hypothetical protein M758_6G108700 [Ceratodon purpureus]|uniref:Uncharacterized protein n=1 Tax=Ceratodon purpureus TaxID=3225 RepID=A0A8T0HH84_CERPU|nr:hypothetical protein KC19_6G112600 [Ceratodon purpureus]KAG0613506.1 hypothetical protein M758_6G108700 [Ceratodon purpureus]
MFVFCVAVTLMARVDAKCCSLGFAYVVTAIDMMGRIRSSKFHLFFG